MTVRTTDLQNNELHAIHALKNVWGFLSIASFSD